MRFEVHTGDGLLLTGREFTPDRTPRAVICLVHGHGEHSGRYLHVADFLNRAGHALLALDLRGHGESAGQRGHFDGLDALMDDIACLLTEADERYPGIPLFLYGHSMGGNLAINYVLRRKPQLNGIIASAPMLRTAFEAPLWKRVIGKAMRYLWPTLSMSSGLQSEDLSRDPEVVRAYDEDPLVHDRVTPMFLGLLQAGEWALRHAGTLTIPMLLMHGEADRITSEQASSAFAGNAGPGCTYRSWKNLFHEIHNEPEKELVLQCVVDWIQRRLA